MVTCSPGQLPALLGSWQNVSGRPGGDLANQLAALMVQDCRHSGNLLPAGTKVAVVHAFVLQSRV
jgi:hypothetical protein